MWFNNPQGAPSGVCTGQRNPQQSGSNFLTAVVFVYVKKCPLWIDLKWAKNLELFNLSAITQNPLACIKSRLEWAIKFPVDKKYYIFCVSPPFFAINPAINLPLFNLAKNDVCFLFIAFVT